MCEMNCEEFEVIGLDAERDSTLSEVERVAAREHANTCSRCAALQESWQAAGIDLRAFAEDTAMAQAPARVEMRLRQEFRTQHVTFTLLPGTLAMDADDAAILRVRMQRGALGALGLPVNEERANEWIQVELLVGDDGLPQAVRLPR